MYQIEVMCGDVLEINKIGKHIEGHSKLNDFFPDCTVSIRLRQNILDTLRLFKSLFGRKRLTRKGE